MSAYYSVGGASRMPHFNCDLNVGRRQAACHRRLAGLPQIIQILLVEGAKRGFDRGAEAGYAVCHASAKKRDPYPRLHKNSGRPHCGRAARMQLAIQFGALPGSNLVKGLPCHPRFKRGMTPIWICDVTPNDG